MDAIDLAILASLESDGRQSFTSLADSVNLSKTPCWTRVQVMEQAGVITGYGANINPRALGVGVTAVVQVMINAALREEFENAVLINEMVLECYTTAGEADYLLKVVCKDVDDLDDLLRYNISLMPGVARSTTMICLRTVKSRGSVTAAGRRLPVKRR